MALVLAVMLLAGMMPAAFADDATPQVTEVKINPNALTLEVGKVSTATLSAIVTYDNKTQTVNPKGVAWYSDDGGIASVNTTSGLVTAQNVTKEEKVKITANCGGVTGECTVTVIPQQKPADPKPVTGITITAIPAVNTITVGDTLLLSAKIEPTDASNKEVTWESLKPSVASVGKTTGRVEGLSAGDTIIVAIAADGSGVQQMYNVKVEAPTVKSVSIKGANTVEVNKTIQLTATVEPAAANQEVTWTSETPGVAGVDANSGLVTGLQESTTPVKITAAAGGKTATHYVTVTKQTVPVDSISITPSLQNLTVGDGEQELTATINPNDATSQTVSWTTSNSQIIRLIEDGKNSTKCKIDPVGEGTATITATCGGKSQTCTITVAAQKIAVDSVSIKDEDGIDDIATLKINKGERQQLTAGISPNNATIRTTRWSSSDSQVATVTDRGLVEGTATI